MKRLEIIKNNEELKDKLNEYADFLPFDDFRAPESLNGKMVYNMKGKAFGEAGDGSEFILLEDGSIALGGSEGEVGRIAENFDDFFSLLVNFPCFWDFLSYEYFMPENTEKTKLKFKEEMNDDPYCLCDEYMPLFIEKLGISVDNDVIGNTAQKMFDAVTREPKYGYSYDGEYYDEILTHVTFW